MFGFEKLDVWQEAVAFANIAKRQGFLGDRDFTSLSSQAEHLARMLSGLKSSLRRKPS